MQKIKIVLLLAFFPLIMLGQNMNKNLFLVSDNETSKYYVEINKNNAYVISIDSRFHKTGRYYYIALSLDSLSQSVTNKEYLFVGNKTKILFVKNKPCLIIQEKISDKPKFYPLDSLTDNTIAFNDINNGIWSNEFYQMCKEMNTRFPLQRFSPENSFCYWNSFVNKDEYYGDFQFFSKTKIKKIKDSLVFEQTQLVNRTNELLKNITTIEYSNLKSEILKLPIEYKRESWYFGTVLNALCISRPELFYKLVQDIPERKEMLFDLAYINKDARKMLKKAKTDSPLKKEFVKRNRKEKVFAICASTLYASMVVSFWGGIIYLIAK